LLMERATKVLSLLCTGISLNYVPCASNVDISLAHVPGEPLLKTLHHPLTFLELGDLPLPEASRWRTIVSSEQGTMPLERTKDKREVVPEQGVQYDLGKLRMPKQSLITARISRMAQAKKR
jgi:hypothetical protein